MRTPDKAEDFSAEWLKFVMRPFFHAEETDFDSVKIESFGVDKNEVQGILSTTFIAHVDYSLKGGDEVKRKSLFVKVPLKNEPQFESVNRRELVMFNDVLPKLQGFLDEKCEGFFQLPMPKCIHSYYDGRGIEDVFVMDNLLEEGYYNFTNEKCLNVEHMNAVLDSLCYLHGTGLAFKHSVGNDVKKMHQEFPNLDVQLQLDDLIERASLREHFRQHFRPFLHFLEEAEPALKKHAAYMKKMHKHILSVIENLERCGYEKLVTLAHGDAKPNNFMFRKIEIDLEELECEGIDPILIDWQGGFIGSAANDLMWALFPFVEKDLKLFDTAVEYYFDQLRTVLESFNVSYEDLGIPDTLPEFTSLLKKCLVLEFLIVTVIKPIMSIEKHEKLLKWHKETEKNKRRRFKKQAEKPEMVEVLSSPRFTGFCHLYFKIATALGAFQELGSIYFETMKENMFQVEKLDVYDSDEEDDKDIISRVINAPAKTLIRASAGIVLIAGVLIGVYFAYQNNLFHDLTKHLKPYLKQ